MASTRSGIRRMAGWIERTQQIYYFQKAHFCSPEAPDRQQVLMLTEKPMIQDR
ncbi:hypothetical protein J6590_018339 [Homalodisca vitripennis]|nr:hypothetical protein J6590_018339 [Homalodisca vitripennis]